MTEVHSYQLTTAENELGVVIAHSDAGLSQYFINCRLFKCLIPMEDFCVL